MTSASSGHHLTSALVTADWLASRLDEIIVLDASIARTVGPDGATRFGNGREVFEAGHIPGARFADLFDGFSDPTAPFPFTRPTVPQIEAAARALGVCRNSTVVAYDSLSGAWAARLWWVLRSFGFKTVHVLNGGLAAWRAGGYAVKTGPSGPPSQPGDFVAAPQDGFFTDLRTVKSIAEHRPAGTVLICGTRRAEFIGTENGGNRPGHIPGSLSLPYPDLLDANGKMEAGSSLAQWAALGCGTPERVVLYCGGGINAAGLALGLSEAGVRGLTIFDGSLNEWRADATLPMEIGGPDRPGS
ncbi:MAG TPA: rhodanese-like domain-containing protein [Acetobacteraceae bacterium]|nr:rhodanese-like domain-containing protein [Acetobacteraceae bacterium]